MSGQASWRVRWGERLADAFWIASEFLELRRDDNAALRFEEEVRELVRPCLAILMHKRAKLLAAGAGSPAPEARWRTELGFYVERILWPMLAGAQAGRRWTPARVAALVEAFVAGEQARVAATPAGAPPVIWRVETGWAG